MRHLAALCCGRLASPIDAELAAGIARDAAADQHAVPDDAGRLPALTDYAPMRNGLAGWLGVRLRVIACWRVATGARRAGCSSPPCRARSYPIPPLPLLLWEAVFRWWAAG